MTSTYLAFDLGASTGRAVLGRLEHGRLRLEEVHRFRTPLREEEGHLFWDLDALWREARRGLERGLERAPEIRSLSVDSWAVDYVPLGADGAPLRDAFCYRDPRTQGRLDELFALMPAADIYGRTGIQMLEINTVVQLLADLDAEPERVAQTEQRLMIAEYLLYRLSGRAVTERTMASTTQLMNVRTHDWDDVLLERLGLRREAWPEVVAPGTVLGPLQTNGEPAPAEEPSVVATCSHDTASAVAAVPADAASSWAYLSSGTWSLMGVELDVPVLTEAARAANFTNEAGLDDTIRFLKNLTGLWVLQECERAWRERGDTFTYDELLAEASAAPRPERFVDLDAPRFATRCDMPAELRDYCGEHAIPVPRSRGELVRLILESLAERYRQTLAELEGLLGTRIDVLHVVGGGAQNELLCQWTADACGCRVVAGPAEATAVGNLLVQARTLGDLPPGTTIRDVVRRSFELHTYEPSGDWNGNDRVAAPDARDHETQRA